jgi:hypothetical protein
MPVEVTRADVFFDLFGEGVHRGNFGDVADEGLSGCPFLYEVVCNTIDVVLVLVDNRDVVTVLGEPAGASFANAAAATCYNRDAFFLLCHVNFLRVFAVALHKTYIRGRGWICPRTT